MSFSTYFVAATPYPEKALEDRMYGTKQEAWTARDKYNAWARRNVFNVYEAIFSEIKGPIEESPTSIPAPVPAKPTESQEPKENIQSLRDINTTLRKASQNETSSTYTSSRSRSPRRFGQRHYGKYTPENNPATDMCPEDTVGNGSPPHQYDREESIDRSLQRIYPQRSR